MVMKKESKICLLLYALFVLVGCTHNGSKTHKTAEEIYQSGVIDTSDFELVVRDTNAVRDTLRYKYDSNLIVQRNYHYGFSKPQGFAFYYNGKPEGKWTLLRESGDTQAIFLFKNGLKNGDWLSFNGNSIVQFKTHYENDREVYRIEYDHAGKVIDSVRMANE